MNPYTSIFFMVKVFCFQLLLVMDVPSGSGNAVSSSRQLFSPLEANVYLCDYAERLDVRQFLAMPASGDSSTVYDAQHGARRNTRVGAWIMPWAHWCGHGAMLRQDSAPRIDKTFYVVPKNAITSCKLRGLWLSMSMFRQVACRLQAWISWHSVCSLISHSRLAILITRRWRLYLNVRCDLVAIAVALSVGIVLRSTPFHA